MSGERGAPGRGAGAVPLMVAGFAVSFVLVGGGINTVGVFVNALAQANDWSRSALSLAVSLGALAAAAATPVVGRAIDRFGVRVPMCAGALLLAFGFAILVGMRRPWHFVAANLLLGPGFAASALLPMTVAITLCVRERTALALGVAGAGSSAGALMLAPSMQALVEGFGWREAYVVLGAAVVLTPLPFLALVLPRGRLARDGVDPGSAVPVASLSMRAELRRPGVLPLAAVMVLPALVGFGISVHLVPYLVGGGLSGRVAALALGAAIGVSAVGKICGGLLADRVGALGTLRLALLLGAVACALLLASPSALPLLAAFVVLYGLGIGGQVAVVPVLAKQMLGAERFGTLFGVLQLGALLAAALGPLLAGVLYDAWGRYTEAILIWMAGMGIALLLSAGLAVAGPPAAVAAADSAS